MSSLTWVLHYCQHQSILWWCNLETKWLPLVIISLLRGLFHPVPFPLIPQPNRPMCAPCWCWVFTWRGKHLYCLTFYFKNILTLLLQQVIGFHCSIAGQNSTGPQPKSSKGGGNIIRHYIEAMAWLDIICCL